VSMLRVASVEVLEGYQLRLTLSDGNERVVDVDPYLQGPIFHSLKADRSLFAAVRVDHELGTIVWPNGADICPDVLIHGRTPVALEGAAGSRSA